MVAVRFMSNAANVESSLSTYGHTMHIDFMAGDRSLMHIPRATMRRAIICGSAPALVSSILVPLAHAVPDCRKPGSEDIPACRPRPQKPGPPVVLGNYDLVSDSADDNGIPRNPRWAKQERYRQRTGKTDYTNPEALPSIRPDCLDFSKKGGWNLYDGYNPFIGNSTCRVAPTTIDNCWFGKCLWGHFETDYHVSGHANFQPATFEGPLQWECADSIPKGGDVDWTMNIYPANGAGATGSDGRVHLEWDPTESGEDFTTPWWSSFRKGIHDGWSWKSITGYDEPTCTAQRKTVGAAFMDGRRGIVTGLLGLDLGHSSASVELHPVWAIAIHANGVRASSLQPDPAWDTLPSVPLDDTWAVMARNWGNEGYCSSGDSHFLETKTISIRIPWPTNATQVEVLPSTTIWGSVSNGNKNDSSDLGWGYWIDPKKEHRGLVFVADLPRPAAHANVYGELHLKWTLATQRRVPPIALAALAPVEHVGRDGHDGHDGGETAPQLIKRMTKEQRRAFESATSALPAEAGPSRSPALRLRNGTVAKAAATPPKAPPLVSPILDAERRGRDHQRLTALCAVYKGHFPEPWFKQACDGLPRMLGASR